MIIWVVLNVFMSCVGVFVSMVIYRRYHKDVVIVNNQDQVISDDCSTAAAAAANASRPNAAGN